MRFQQFYYYIIFSFVKYYIGPTYGNRSCSLFFVEFNMNLFIQYRAIEFIMNLFSNCIYVWRILYISFSIFNCEFTLYFYINFL